MWKKTFVSFSQKRTCTCGVNLRQDREKNNLHQSFCKSNEYTFSSLFDIFVFIYLFINFVSFQVLRYMSYFGMLTRAETAGGAIILHGLYPQKILFISMFTQCQFQSELFWYMLITMSTIWYMHQEHKLVTWPGARALSCQICIYHNNTPRCGLWYAKCCQTILILRNVSMHMPVNRLTSVNTKKVTQNYKILTTLSVYLF